MDYNDKTDSTIVLSVPGRVSAGDGVRWSGNDHLGRRVDHGTMQQVRFTAKRVSKVDV